MPQLAQTIAIVVSAQTDLPNKGGQGMKTFTKVVLSLEADQAKREGSVRDVRSPSNQPHQPNIERADDSH